jgi:hypothetical protein
MKGRQSARSRMPFVHHKFHVTVVWPLQNRAHFIMCTKKSFIILRFPSVNSAPSLQLQVLRSIVLNNLLSLTMIFLIRKTRSSPRINIELAALCRHENSWLPGNEDKYTLVCIYEYNHMFGRASYS